MSAAGRRVGPAASAAALPLTSSLLAIGAAFAAGALFLLVMGKDAGAAYERLVRRGLLSDFGATETLIKAAPLLIVAAGLLICLRAGVWNIGIDGQFLIGALLTGYVAPNLVGNVPNGVMLAISCLVGLAGGLAWAIVPAWLKVRFGLNEIITTIMMNYVAISFTAYLVKGPLKDPKAVPPQTEVIPRDWRLPDLPGGEVHAGLVVGIVAVLAAGFVYRSTTLGVKLWVLGQNRRAALHAGLPVGGLTAAALLISGGFAGLAGANDVLSTNGLFKANWYPEYGLAAFALVYLARLRALWALPFAYFFGWLSLGGDLLRSEEVPDYFVGMLEGLMLLFLAVAFVVERRVTLPSRLAPETRTVSERERIDRMTFQPGAGEFDVTINGVNLEDLVTVLLSTGLIAAVPLTLAALGECFVEQAGLLNLGLEGMMLSGAFFGYWAAKETDNIAAGLATGALVGWLFGLLFAVLAVTLRVDQILIGLAITIFGAGLTGFLFRDFYGREQALDVRLPRLGVPGLKEIPVIGPAIFDQQILVYLTWALVPVLSWLLLRTRFGLEVRAAGENPFAADASGVNVLRVRYQAMFLGGTLGGLAGAFLSVAELRFFNVGMTVGTGFIALAITMLGRWRPYRILIGAVTFGLLRSLQTGLPIVGVDVRIEFLQMIPYLGIILALVVLAGRTALPSALAIPYERGHQS